MNLLKNVPEASANSSLLFNIKKKVQNLRTVSKEKCPFPR